MGDADGRGPAADRRQGFGGARAGGWIDPRSPGSAPASSIGASISDKTFYHYGKTFYLSESFMSCRRKGKGAGDGARRRAEGGRNERGTAARCGRRPYRAATLSLMTRWGLSTRSTGSAAGLSRRRIMSPTAWWESSATFCSIEVSEGSNSASAALLS